ncbi:PKD domain-containing protein [Microbacterium insulae]|uniref:PKD domain-containing protein n=1 Tax=Microbacterium insulae TaxID=483014 RepID=A0ABW3AHE3_9MICO
MRTHLRRRTRAAAVLGIAALCGALLAVPTAANASGAPPASPTLVAPADGGTTAPGSSLSVRANDPDDPTVEVTFHAAARGTVEPGAGGSPFTFLVIPDTQNYVLTAANTPLLQSQLQWIVDNRSSLNLAFAAGLGDIVDNRLSDAQWGRATTSMAILDDAGVPHSVIPGNHDYDLATGDFSKYDQYFPVSRYRDATWNSANASYGGYYGQNEFGPDPVDRGNMNNYALFQAGGMKFLTLNLELNPPDDVLAWAQRVLDAHSDRRAIVSTHSYLAVSGNLSLQQLRTDVAGNSGAQIWQKLIRPNCSIFLVVNGHFTDGLDGEAHRTDLNDCGQPVRSALSDFQGRPNGGDGWLRWYTFTPSAGTITATTYSPTLDQYETDADSAFTWNYDMTPPADLPVVGRETVSAGAVASVPLPDAPEGTVLDWYATVDDGTSVTRGPTWTTTVQPPAATPLIADSFARSVTAGWGTADAGGAWVVNSTSKLSATGGVGRISSNAGSTLTATLPAVDSTAVDARATLSFDRIPNRSLTFTTAARQVGSNAYAARTVVNANGTFTVHAMRDGTALAGGTVPGATLTPGAKLRLRVQVEGTSPTTIRARAWLDGAAEPTSWTATATDSTAALQQPGGLRFTSYLSSSATNGPVIVSVDDVSMTRIGTPPPSNTAPTAEFTWQADGLTVTADSSASADSDGTLTARTWSFAGAPASGTTATHTFAASGTYPVTLTVTDDDGAVGTVTKNVTVTAPAQNAPPTAEFTWQADGLTVTADSSGSADSDGTLTARAWSFAGTSATGTTATHTFAASGTYPVTLTVTDDDGATGTVTKNVTVTAPPPPPTGALASDQFARTVGSGWGTADTGGAWTVNSTAKLTVTGGVGRVSSNSGSTLTATLGGVSSSRADTTVTVSLDRVPNQYLDLAVQPRVVGTSFYGVRVRVNPNGSVGMQNMRGSTALTASSNAGGLVVTPGARIKIRVQVEGTSPTTIRARAWLDGSPEPTAWHVTSADSTSGLQGAGSPRLGAYLSSSATNGLVIVSFDDLTVAAIP